MNNGIVLLGVCFVLMLVISGFATLVYVLIYKGLVNRRVQAVNAGAAKTDKAPPSPIKMFFVFLIIGTVFFVLLIVFLILSFVNVKHFDGGTTTVTATEDAYMAVAGEDDLLTNLSPEDEISGYDRYEETDGDYHFIIYTSHGDEYSPFPLVMIYAEYTGSGDCSLSYDAMFRSSDKDFASENGGSEEGAKALWLVPHTNGMIDSIELYLSGSEAVYDTDPETAKDVGKVQIDMTQFYR